MLYAGRKGYAEASITSNSVNLISSPVAMIKNPAEKIDKCPLIGVVEYYLRTVGTTKTVRCTE